MKILTSKKYRNIKKQIRDLNDQLISADKLLDAALREKKNIERYVDTLNTEHILFKKNKNREIESLKEKIRSLENSRRKSAASAGGYKGQNTKLKRIIEQQDERLKNYREEYKRNRIKKTPSEYYQRIPTERRK